MTGFSNIGKASGFAGVDGDGNPSGDLTGSYPNPLVKGIWDNPVDPREPNNGDTLVYNGGEWIPTPSPSNTAALFKGVWNANTNTPDIANYPGLSDGFTWLVQVAGNTNVGGITGWLIGDYAIYSGGNWYKLSNSSFGWGLTGNAGTIPTVNYVGTSDDHDLSIRANGVEGFRIFYTGGTQATGDMEIVGSLNVDDAITGSNGKFYGDLEVDGGNISTTSTSFNLVDTIASVINFAGGASTLTIGNAAGVNTVRGDTKFPQGLSGSLTKLVDGSDYLLPGSNVTLSTGSSGAITISAPNLAPSTSAFVTIGNDSTLTNERALTAGLGLRLTDAGANSSVTLGINDSIVATISGSTFTGAVKFNAGLSGSLTKLSDGTSYIIAGNNIAVASGSNGPVTVSFTTTTPPTSSDVLIYNGTTWNPSSIISTLQTSYQTVRAASNIAAGDVCYIVNSGGSNDYPTVDKAQANDLTKVRGVIGLATTAIANNAIGTVQTYGQLPGPVNTQGFAQGAPLYVSTTVAGGVTDVKPQGPNFAFQIGFVTRQGQPQNVTTGIVFISPMMQTDTYNINNIIHTNAKVGDVLICSTAAQPAGGGLPALPPVWTTNQFVKQYQTNAKFAVNAGDQITTAAFDTSGSRIVFLPISSGNSAISLASPKPIADLTSNDYGRLLWLYNAGNANIIIPRAGGGNRNVALEGGTSQTLAPGALIKLMWIDPGSGQAVWLQTDKVIIST